MGSVDGCIVYLPVNCAMLTFDVSTYNWSVYIVTSELYDIMLLNRSMALAAAGSSTQLRIQNIVILSMPILSTLGAAWIVANFVVCRLAKHKSAKIDIE